jgi:transcriptional regulator with XRE-family HTH domain
MKINAGNLKRARQALRLSLDDVAKMAKVDRQTVHRLESGRTTRCRANTLNKLASALRTSAAALTGPDQDFESVASEPRVPKTQVNLRLSNDVRNAINLMAVRYGVKGAHIVALAPYLFHWAAEASLAHRKQAMTRVEEAEDAYTRSVPEHIRSGYPFRWDVENALERERRSIRERDLLGTIVDEFQEYEEKEGLTASSDGNPFAIFLRSLTEALPEGAQFHAWSEYGGPTFEIGKGEALELVGGVDESAHYIVSGSVGLHEVVQDAGKSDPQELSERVLVLGRQRKAELDELFADLFARQPDISTSSQGSN